jgi:hypothetical protein
VSERGTGIVIKPLTDAEVAVDAAESPQALRQLKLSYIKLRTAYEEAVKLNGSLAAMATAAEKDRHLMATRLTVVELERDEARVRLKAANKIIAARLTDTAMTDAERLVYAVAFATTVIHLTREQLADQPDVPADIARQAVEALRKAPVVDSDQSAELLRVFKESP